MSPYVRYAVAGVLTGICGMYALLARPPFDPPGAAPARTVDRQGRIAETFRIRPGDIIALTGDLTLAGHRFPATIKPVGAGMPASSVMTAKLRNAAGEVVGIASRYTLPEESDRPADRLWTLVITRRGSIATQCVDAASPDCGTVIGGAGSFAGFRGKLVETPEGRGIGLTLISSGSAL